VSLTENPDSALVLLFFKRMVSVQAEKLVSTGHGQVYEHMYVAVKFLIVLSIYLIEPPI
jgi:hypothetical protein